MLLLALVPTSDAFTPDGASEIWVDSGYVLDHPALGFGGGHAWRAGPARFGASAAIGARATQVIDDFPSHSPYGLGTVWAGVTSSEIGIVAIVDVALLAAEEEDCDRHGENCRHTLWVGNQTFGVSAQPAGGLLFGGEGVNGGRWTLVLGLQPHVRYGDRSTLACPRVDFVASVTKHTAFHFWAGRYGIAIGIGHVLGGE